MANFDPEFQVVSLDQAPLGALVIFDGAPAFVGVNPAAGIKVLAQYQSNLGQFVYRFSDTLPVPRVLLPEQEMIVIRPKFGTFTVDVNIGPPSSQLFIDQTERFVAVNIPSAHSHRLLSLNSGNLISSTTTQKDAFTSWEIGLKSLGQFRPLLTI